MHKITGYLLFFVIHHTRTHTHTKSQQKAQMSLQNIRNLYGDARVSAGKILHFYRECTAYIDY